MSCAAAQALLPSYPLGQLLVECSSEESSSAGCWGAQEISRETGTCALCGVTSCSSSEAVPEPLPRAGS